MVNNIVYFGRIIATILLIRLISLIRLIRPISLISLIRPIRLIASLPSLQGRAGVRLFSCQPLSRHSRATLVPLRFFRFLRLPSVGLQTPETGLPPGPFVCLLCRILSGLQSLKSLWTLKTLETLETLSLSGGLLVFQIRCKDNIKVTLVFL